MSDLTVKEIHVCIAMVSHEGEFVSAAQAQESDVG